MLAKALYRVAEARGVSARLDGRRAEEDSTYLLQKSEITDSLALPWSVRSACRFKAPAHINLQEARAIRREIKHLARADSVAKRVLVFIDSLVVLGAFAKGRSSSF